MVPPNQAEVMFAAMKERGVPTALVMFEGEQHGFRQAPNIRYRVGGCVLREGSAWRVAAASVPGAAEAWEARPGSLCSGSSVMMGCLVCPCNAAPPALPCPALRCCHVRLGRRCRRALDGELYFYGRVLGFQPKMPDDFQPIEIANI